MHESTNMRSSRARWLLLLAAVLVGSLLWRSGTPLGRSLPIRPRRAVAFDSRGRRYTPVDPSSVCVIAADDRPLDEVAGLAEDLSYYATTTAMQLLWAERHGYTYRRLLPTPLTDRSISWHRMPLMEQTIKACEWTMCALRRFEVDAAALWTATPSSSG